VFHLGLSIILRTNGTVEQYAVTSDIIETRDSLVNYKGFELLRAYVQLYFFAIPIVENVRPQETDN
jgi:ABC-type spermidine/putrescine transport system permease subunit I